MRGLLCVLLALTAIALASRPRGVAPADKALYQGNQFKCRDGSFVISIKQVNDDYCDCPDGSDEPGTSACSNGAFWCKNKGFRSFTVPSWKVNDHICDCCDGSDEFDGHTHCTNNCAELDRESKQSVVAELERLKSGLEKKRGYIAAGEEALKKAAASIADLKAEIEHKREELKVKEERKRKAEESERDAAEARRLKEEEEKAAHEAAHPSPPPPPVEDAPHIVDAELHHDHDHHHDGGDHADFDTVHDEAKGDVPEDLHQPIAEEPTPAPVEAAPSDQPPFEPSEELKDLQAEEQKHADGPLPPPHIREELERGYLAARKAKQSLWQTAKSAVADWFHSLMSALSSVFGDSDDEGEDGDSGDAKRARDTFNDATGKLRELEVKLDKAEKLLQLDLGPQKEFFPLYDRTFTTQIEHYQYHLKPFDEVNQGHTNMGKWGSWSVPHTKMSYSNGQSCWQGPARSCEVTLVCGEKEEILEVKEPNKCEYSMKFATPAACREADVERLERQLKASESDDE